MHVKCQHCSIAYRKINRLTDSSNTLTHTHTHVHASTVLSQHMRKVLEFQDIHLKWLTLFGERVGGQLLICSLTSTLLISTPPQHGWQLLIYICHILPTPFALSLSLLSFPLLSPHLNTHAHLAHLINIIDNNNNNNNKLLCLHVCMPLQLHSNCFCSCRSNCRLNKRKKEIKKESSAATQQVAFARSLACRMTSRCARSDQPAN